MHLLTAKEAVELVKEVHIGFVLLGLAKIRAQKSWTGNKARDELISWIELDKSVRDLAFMSKPEMKKIASELGFDIPSSLKVEQYRQRLGRAINGGEEDKLPPDGLEMSMVKAMLNASTLKLLKPGKEEGQSKYTLFGQRLEKPAMETCWAYLNDKNVFERNGELESL